MDEAHIYLYLIVGWAILIVAILIGITYAFHWVLALVLHADSGMLWVISFILAVISMKLMNANEGDD